MTATATFTDPKTWAFQEGVESSELNIHLRDNLNSMGPHLIVRKTADQTVTSSTTLVDCTSMLLTVAANEIWRVSFNIIYSADGSPNIKFAFTFPASGRIIVGGIGQNTAGATQWRLFEGTTTPTNTADFVGTGSSVQKWLALEGVFINAGTAGNLQLQFAQNTSNVNNTTVNANSTVWAVKLA
jgi:hypothetical protein